MKTVKTLYKMTNTGKIQSWSISVCTDSRGIYYEVTHGQLDGKKQTSKTYISSGKNIGKANETTVLEQCELEALSLWTKKRDRGGYTVEIPKNKPMMPMLAKNYTKDGKHIKFPCYIQGKLDGIRCLVKVRDGKIEIVSRKNKKFRSLRHLESSFSEILENCILDGELYSDELTFQEIASAVKRDEPNDLSEKIKVVFYDMISDRDYEKRFEVLKLIVANLDYADVVPYDICSRSGNVDKYLERYIDKGYEGVMLRNLSGPYKINGRSKDLQKYKKFIDDEFLLVDIVEGTGKFAGMGVFLCEGPNGRFKATPKIDEKGKRELFQNKDKYIGGKVTIRYFELTDGGLPRFPIGTGVRNYE